MAEIASNIGRVYPDGAREGTYVFTTDTVPPRFAMVDVEESTIWVTGPLTEEQLAVELEPDERVLGEKERNAYRTANPLGYSMEADEIVHSGDYPGGPDRMALNLARFALGA